MIPETNSFAEHFTPQERRLEEIVLEFLKAQDAGREPDRQRLLAENPDLAGELQAFFADQNDLDTLIPPLPALKLLPTDLPERVGDYQIQEEIGHGGMGVVYKAKHFSSGQVVALKMIRDREFCTPEVIDRFLREARTVAGFDHPNLVPLFFAGEFDGQPYFSMKYVEGGSLAQLPPSFNNNPQTAARILVKVARAIEYAHGHGILHRDLKPANVLLDRDGFPYVADFGLAMNASDEGTDLTERGALVGTVAYMSPEQAFADKRLTTRADVYGLGAILYELLTGRPPFRGKDTYDTINQVRHGEPVRPRALKRKLPRDLESICLKCLCKQPDKRYASAAAVADDLERFLAGRPTKARPVSAAERLLKWAKRRPAVAALTMAVFLTALVGLGAFVNQSWQTNRALEDAEYKLYVHLIARAAGYLDKGKADQADSELQQCPEPLRHFEWNFLNRWCQGDLTVFQGHTKYVRCLACSPDGRLIATGGDDGDVRLWDAHHSEKESVVLESSAGRRNPVTSIAFSRDGSALAAARESNSVTVWDVATRTVRFNQPGAGKWVDLSPNAELVAAAQTEEVQVWDVASRKLRHTLRTDNYINGLAFSRDGRYLATAGYGEEKEQLWLWDLRGATKVAVPNKVQDWANRVAFHPRREQLAMLQGSIVSLWDLDKTGEKVRLQRGELGVCTGIAYNEDGRYLAASYNRGVVTVWDTTARQKVVFSARRDRTSFKIPCVAFLPGDGGRRIVYGRRTDVVVERWQTNDGRESRAFLHQKDKAVRALVFGPSPGSNLISVSDDETVRWWDPAGGKGPPPLKIPGMRPAGLALPADGSSLAAALEDGTVHLLDARSGARRRILTGHGAAVRAVAFSPDGKWLASASLDRTFRVWDLSGSQQPWVQTLGPPLQSVVFDPDGKHLVVGGENGLMEQWDLASRGRVRSRQGHKNNVNHLAISPDGRWLASAGADALVRLWDARSGAPVKTWDGHTGTVTGVAFSPDGKRLASCGLDGTIKLWDTVRLQEVLSLGGHDSPAVGVAFSADGNYLASAHLDGAVRLWDGAP